MSWRPRWLRRVTDPSRPSRAGQQVLRPALRPALSPAAPATGHPAGYPGLNPMADERDVPDEIAFVSCVREELKRMGCRIQRIDVAEAQVVGRLRGTVALVSIQQLCTPRPRTEWPAVVSEHLHGLAAAAERRLDLTQLAPVRHLLRARLYDEAAPEAELLAGRVAAPGLFEALVVDEPKAVHGVPRDVVAGWGEPLDELLDLGRTQVLDAGLLQRQEVDLGGPKALLLEDGSPYTTTHVHWLATYADIGPAGALVAVPNKHCVLALPLSGHTEALTAIQSLMLNAQQLYDDGPGSLSPHLYWWRDGVLTLLPGTVGPGKIELRPPAEFVEVLQDLPE